MGGKALESLQSGEPVQKEDPVGEHLERGSRGVAAGALAMAELKARTSATISTIIIPDKWEL